MLFMVCLLSPPHPPLPIMHHPNNVSKLIIVKYLLINKFNFTIVHNIVHNIPNFDCVHNACMDKTGHRRNVY